MKVNNDKYFYTHTLNNDESLISIITNYPSLLNIDWKQGKRSLQSRGYPNNEAQIMV